MKLVKRQSIYGNYKGLYDRELWKVARSFFFKKLFIALITLISMHFILSVCGLIPALSTQILIKYIWVGALISACYCWRTYTDLLDAKKRHINSLYN